MESIRNIRIFMLAAALVVLTGCATTPMASKTQDAESKLFKTPASGVAGLYIYRNGSFGAAIKKRISIDGKLIGEIASGTYFHNEITPGEHTVTTQAEFGDNSLKLNAEEGKNYFVHQYIKFGTFVGSANVELVGEEEGKKGVLECNEAKQGSK